MQMVIARLNEDDIRVWSRLTVIKDEPLAEIVKEEPAAGDLGQEPQ
jgi:hypothetical protein